MPQVSPTALPMREAIAFWKDKVPMSRAEFDELFEQMQARGFYVSGLTRIDQIEAVKDAILFALEEGETFEGFKQRIPEIIEQQNWSGIRLSIIFRTNVQSAYMAGRYAQMTRAEVLRARPYWRYSAGKRRTDPAGPSGHERKGFSSKPSDLENLVSAKRLPVPMRGGYAFRP